MKKFDTKEDLYEAIAQRQHRNNLLSGGVYNEKGIRHSDIETERSIAKKQKLTFVSRGMADILGKPAGWYYRSFGYVKL